MTSLRSAFMLGYGRSITWEEAVNKGVVVNCIASYNAFMTGHTRNITWEKYSQKNKGV